MNMPPADDFGEISADTDGCRRQLLAGAGHRVGDLENMDNLVRHLHKDHIGTRKKKYSCGWSNCSRKGIPEASEGEAILLHTAW